MVNGQGDDQKVAQGASAMRNIKTALNDAFDALDPTNHIRATWKGLNPYEVNGFLAQLPFAIGAEVWDLASAPFKVSKDLGDAAIQGGLAGVNALKK